MTPDATHAAPHPGPTLDYQSPDPPRRFEWQAVVAWLVIIGCTTSVMVNIAREYKRAAKKGVESPTTEIQIDIAGRAAVGFKLLLANNGSSDPTSAYIQSFVTEMRQLAKTPDEKLRAITVIAEIVGRDEAIKRINELEKSTLPPQQADDLAALRTIYLTNAAPVDDTTRQRLIDRYGFFGRLALTFNHPDNDPPRAAVLKEARQASINLEWVGGIGGVLVALIVIASVGAILLVALNRIRPAYVPQPYTNSAFVEAFAIYLAGFLLFAVILRHFKLEPLAWEWIALIFIPISIGWIYMRGATIDQARFGLGWYRGRGALIEISLGIFGYLACAPFVAAGIWIALKLSALVGVTPSHPIVQMLGGGPWHIFNLYGLACVMAPILEETMFRGALFNHLRRRWRWLISAPIVAFFFAAIHPQGWTMIPGLGAIAIVLAAIREWRGTAMASMAAHALNNAIILTVGLLMTQ